MKRVSVSDLYKRPEDFAGKEITVAGWSRSIRASNVFGFIELNDGSCFKNLQVVFEDAKIDNYKEIASQNTGASFGMLKGSKLAEAAMYVESCPDDLYIVIRKEGFDGMNGYTDKMAERHRRSLIVFDNIIKDNKITAIENIK